MGKKENYMGIKNYFKNLKIEEFRKKCFRKKKKVFNLNLIIDIVTIE